MTYKDQLENRKNARKHALHQNQQDQPAKLASRKNDLLAHLEDDLAGPVTALTLSEIDLYLVDFLERGGVS